MIRFFLIVTITLLSANAFSQEKGIDSIALKLQLCENDSLSTAAKCDCLREVMGYWDKELNANYRLLLKLLDQPGKETLKTSQKEWILFRDKEFELVDKIYYEELQGTMYHPMAWYRKMVIVKNRAIELKNYYELLKDNK